MIGKIISHYRIIEKLGQGGTDIVYCAGDTNLDHMTAIEILSDVFSGGVLGTPAGELSPWKATSELTSGWFSPS